MKKMLLILAGIALLLVNYDVKAKDTVSSYTKYDEDIYKYISKGYNKKNQEEGNLVTGTYKKKKDTETYDEVFVIKYDNNNKIEWEYINETDSINSDVYGINYLYEDNTVSGYFITITKDNILYYLKLDLEGKLIDKQETSQYSKINKIEEILINNTFKGYILSGEKIIDNKKVGVITKYNELLEIEWERDYNYEEYSEVSINDIIPITNNEEITGYNAFVSMIKEDKRSHKLITIDLEGNEINTIKENFEEQDNPQFIKLEKGYIIYGYTHEVKIDNSKSQSYYLIKYNNNNEQQWETIGNTKIDSNEKIKLIVNRQDNNEEYLIMTTNETDKSIEIIKIEENGTISNKIKKITNNYYEIHDFLYENNIIYFIGQINCPEDDNCAYNKKALYLISDEDKVIEVEDHDSKLILVVITILLLLGTGFIAIKKRKIKEEA